MWSFIVSFFLGLIGVKPTAQDKFDKVQSATDKELNRELKAQTPQAKEIAEYWSSHD